MTGVEFRPTAARQEHRRTVSHLGPTDDHGLRTGGELVRAPDEDAAPHADHEQVVRGSPARDPDITRWACEVPLQLIRIMPEVIGVSLIPIASGAENSRPVPNGATFEGADGSSDSDVLPDGVGGGAVGDPRIHDANSNMQIAEKVEVRVTNRTDHL
jgi:hypothetical protein